MNTEANADKQVPAEYNDRTNDKAAPKETFFEADFELHSDLANIGPIPPALPKQKS